MNRQILKQLRTLENSGIDINALIQQAKTKPPRATGWIVRGVEIPNGSFIRTWHKDRPYWGTVQDGTFVMKGKRYETPSAAAQTIFGRPTNGWAVFEIRTPGAKQWQRLNNLKHARRSGLH